jgi:predicted transposase YbfD/YdcC
MDAVADGGFARHFEKLPDPRKSYLVLHPLMSMLVMAVMAILCGCEDWQEVAYWAQCREEWLKTFLDLPHGIPSHDTFGRLFGRLFARLNPDALERCFMSWMKGIVDESQGRLVAIDGKSIRRSFRRGWDKSGMAHLVSAMVSQGENHLVFGQLAVERKSNEIKAIPELLKLLDLKQAVVTIDAIGTQRAIADQIVEQGGHYVLPVKANQKALVENLESVMTDMVLSHRKKMPAPLQFHEQAEEGHGRREVRRPWYCNATAMLRPETLEPWPTIKGMILVERERENYGEFTGQASVQRCFYITSLPKTTAADLAGYIRGHWAVENRLHWHLDVTFNEDQQRIRVGYGAENYSRINRIGLNLIKRDRTVKASIRCKRIRAASNNDYLLALFRS